MFAEMAVWAVDQRCSMLRKPLPCLENHIDQKADDVKYRFYVPMRLATFEKMSRFVLDTFIVCLKTVATVRQSYHLSQPKSKIDSEY